jgi:hypothetical protein
MEDANPFLKLSAKQVASRLERVVGPDKTMKDACEERGWDYQITYQGLRRAGQLDRVMAAKYTTAGAAQ